MRVVSFSVNVNVKRQVSSTDTDTEHIVRDETFGRTFGERHALALAALQEAAVAHRETLGDILVSR